MRRTTRTLTRLVLVLAVALGALVAPPAVPAGAAGEHCFVVRAHQVFLGRSPTASELTSWTTRLTSGTGRWALPQALANSDEWLAVTVTDLYREALDRGPSASDIDYWAARLRRGEMVTRIASLIYGAPEFSNRHGPGDEGILTAMYQRILHRSPGAEELAYWVGEAQVRSNGAIAAAMTAAPESRGARVTALYRAVLERAPDAAGKAYWMDRLRTVNDVRLAIDLASAPEFVTIAQRGCATPVEDVGPTFVLEGRGWGHGRGMSQWGALGYAVDHGWTDAQILAHYYGGTTAGSASDATQRVYLVGSAGTDLTVTQAAAALRVDGSTGTWGAVSVRRLSATTYRVYASATASCSPTWTLVGDTTSSDVAVRSTLDQGDVAARMLTDCRTGRRYRGVLRAVRTGGSVGNAVVNEVSTELLLRGIVPNEVSPSWAASGGGRGAHAVRAQAVAARSYVLAGDTRWGTWATTCDSATCQVYSGFGSEDQRTTAAVTATAGQVRRTGSGAIARTEFGSSSGGWTAGGVFPAVVDEGDAIAANPNHTWAVTVARSTVEAKYPGRGTFLRFESVVRDGRGALGGRVLSVRLVFTGGSVDQTGDQVRLALGLKSTWWALRP